MSRTSPTRRFAAGAHTARGHASNSDHGPADPNPIGQALEQLNTVQPAFQPIVDLATSTTVGYEALARWPHLPAVDPAAVFTAAAHAGRLTEANWECARAAVEAALTAGMNSDLALFINVEAHTGHPRAPIIPGCAHDLITRSRHRLRTVVELTERSLLADPAWVLELVAHSRAQGALIALDDVGAHPDSLTLLDFIAPDIVKLDRPLIRGPLTAQHADIIDAISAHAEATGAVILAEGIETDEHLDQALALGAQLGQGWRFGRPAALPSPLPTPIPSYVLPSHPPARGRHRVLDLPSDIFATHTPRIGCHALLAALTRQIEDYARTLPEPVTILTAFQHAHRFTDAVADRYRDLAANNRFVAALGVDMPATPAPGVRGAHLEPDEKFAHEWTITVVGTHYFAALIATELPAATRGRSLTVPDTAAGDNARRFHFVHTHHRETVAAARSLMRRDPPTAPTTPSQGYLYQD